MHYSNTRVYWISAIEVVVLGMTHFIFQVIMCSFDKVFPMPPSYNNDYIFGHICIRVLVMGRTYYVMFRFYGGCFHIQQTF